jgi:hypothetical protein
MEAWEHISIGSFEAEARRTTFFVVLLAGAGLGASLLPWKLSALIDCLFWSQVEAYTIKPPGKSLKTIARNGWGTGCSALALPRVWHIIALARA